MFVWTGLIDPADLQTSFLDASIKARFVNADGEKTGDLLSEGITLQPGPSESIRGEGLTEIPEPITLVSLGLGLTGVGLLRRRKNATAARPTVP